MTGIARREALRRLGKIGHGCLLAWSGAAAACASASEGSPTQPSGSSTSTTTSEPLPAGTSPRLGAHALAFNFDGNAVAPLSIGAISTQSSGSTLLACVGRGVVSTQVRPTDNKGNMYVQNGGTRTYSLWPDSGTALYVCTRATGGAGHVVTVDKSRPADETTLTVVEIVDGGVVQDVQWREARAGEALRSASVTTTGAAVLVAWWWGDAGVDRDKTAVPDGGFTVIESVLREGALVQCAVAYREVAAAGTYSVTWTSTPTQGAQLWLAAVQRASSD